MYTISGRSGGNEHWKTVLPYHKTEEIPIQDNIGQDF